MNTPCASRFKVRPLYVPVTGCVCVLSMLAFLGTGIAQTQPTQDNTWQYSVALEKGTERRAYLWIPPRCEHLFQTGPDTFQVAARSGGLTRQGQPWEPWIIAYQPGDAEYRSADKPAHILVDIRNTEGLAQKIAFQKISDADRRERQITLTATSSSGLPVQLYVESGPASVEGNTLHLLTIPPHSRYPVRVIVSAYQWGRAGEHLVQSAGPETQEFFIRR